MARTWLRRIAGAVGLGLGAAGVSTWRWRRVRLGELAAGSELIETDLGVVEVARRGTGYPVLVLHGDPGGYDQGLLVGESLFGEGFEFVAPSRPGYLRTPLDWNRSPAEQAALLVSLLDELDVDEVLVLGVSGAGPHALQMAAEYPELVSGVVLSSAVTDELDERLFETGNPVVDPVLTSVPVLDAVSGLVALLGRFAPDVLLRGFHGMTSTLEGAELDDYVESVRRTPVHRQRTLDLVRSLLPMSSRVEGTLNDERWFRDLPLVDYGEIEAPVLVLHGEYDAAVPIAQSESVATALPDAEFVRLEADHSVWVGPDAERAAGAVREFSDSVVESVEAEL